MPASNPTSFTHYIIHEFKPLGPVSLTFKRFVLRDAGFPRDIQTLEDLERYMSNKAAHLRRAATGAWRHYARARGKPCSGRPPGRPRKTSCEAESR